MHLLRNRLKMSTYHRTIKFHYYRANAIHNVGDEHGKWPVDGPFNVENWLSFLKDNGQWNRNVELGDCVANLESVYAFSTEDPRLYAFRIYKIRSKNLPALLKEGERATEIPLEEGEHVAEGMNCLYDATNAILMIQQNRASLGTTRLAEWMTMSFKDSNKRVVLNPIMRDVKTGFFKGKRAKKLDFTLASVEDIADTNVNLSQIMGMLHKFNGVNCHISFSMGNYRKGELNPVEVQNMIEEVTGSEVRSAVNAAKVTVTDDDKSRTETVDLFDEVFHDFIEVEIEEDKPLSFDQARKAMYIKYMERLSDLIGQR